MRSRAHVAAFAFVTALAAVASAQPGRRPVPSAPPSTPAPAPTMPGNVRAHVGSDYAARLLRSQDPDERLRGIQRAASIGTAESVALLVQAAETSPAIKSDTRALVELARALSKFADQDRPRAALLALVNAGNPSIAGRLPASRASSGDALSLEEGDPVARAELARQTAAIALARSANDRALEQLYGIARGGGSGQGAAMLALTIQPPRDPGFFGTSGLTLQPHAVRLLGQLGDLRALDVIHGAARSTDVNVRCAALLALAELGDERAIGLARTAIAEADARLRAAAGEVFVVLNAAERFKAISALVSDEATTAIGVKLADRVHDAEITKLLAARVIQHPDREVRANIVRALGRSPFPEAAKTLTADALLADPAFGYEAALALARSPAPNAGTLVAALMTGKNATLGVRAYVTRALVRGERSSAGDSVLARLAASRDGRERALGVFSLVALGDAKAETHIGDPDPRVRRAAAMGTLRRPSKSDRRALLARLPNEPDAATRQVLAIGLLDGDPEAELTTTLLLDRAESGGADAPLATLALTRRADESMQRKLGQLLGAKDAVVRAHAARGVAWATLPDVTGRLADLYAYETDVGVRRAVLGAIAARTKDATAPSRRTTLEIASTLDPDGLCRQIAKRGLDPTGAPLGAAAGTETAWLRITTDAGGAPDARRAYVGSVVRSDGIAVPIAFDDDGYAIVPGLPPGDVRLVLAPRLPSYEAPSP
ncbi:MAG: HEAT repeat domain-containing protein [Deltaproteobacteria bacterium]|nr:HEAT repeat domain-containing protein [Deltaproteobacteria bacterium]